ncbi:helix-turn-helix domain-containing protein [Sphingomonas sp. SUN019]|uniref:helix-turn-helix domain-containing protein n=1 Tax=Sphingomonas sp. SUN019 TaxID=2937788 RepID=UPI0021640961|nr:helix-turn-helix domain-containing protein [Sphingomonas sp. SUN019]UVO50667.1 helix-turn-helix domain-containing protein [Sphingomonas sp. SUN019]
MNAVQKFDTLGLAPAERLPFWNELVDRVYTGTWVNTAKPDFAAEMWRWKVGDLNMIRPRSDPAQVGRDADRAADEEQIVLHLQRRGTSCHRQNGREALLNPGDFVLMSAARPYLVDLAMHELLVVQFPRRLIEHKIRGLDDRLGTTISGAGAGGRVFHDFLLSLWHQGDQSHADPDWQAGVATVFADLAALAVNIAPVGRPLAGGGHLRERVLALVDTRLGDPDLRAATIAEELGISPRTVQNVFAAMGTTPAGHVAEQRLERAAEILTSNSAISVTEIAFDLGFNDSAYFARCFRQRYGRTPSAYRAGA